MTTAHLSLLRQGLEDLSLSFLVLLETLALVERAVFPLREVFAYQRSVPQPPGPASPTSTGSPNRGHAVTRCAVNPPHDPQKVRMSPVSGPTMRPDNRQNPLFARPDRNACESDGEPTR